MNQDQRLWTPKSGKLQDSYQDNLVISVTKLCLTLCNPVDCSLPGFSVRGISQARILHGLPFLPPGDLLDPGLELMCVCELLSHVRLFVTLWTVAHQAPLSMGFPKEEYWSGLPFPPPEDLSDPWIKPLSPTAPALQEDSLPLKPPGKP